MQPERFNPEEHQRLRAERLSKVSIHNPKLLGLATVEINPSELCNRTCSFCPRHDPEVYPNRKLHMAIETARLLSDQLHAEGFDGEIHITGYGEPLLNPDILGLIKAFADRFHVEIITNGDRLTSGQVRLEQLYEAGLASLIVDCYDGPDQVLAMNALLASSRVPWRVRNHHDTGEAALVSVFQFNNRGGMLGKARVKRPCFMPMYKAFVDWNGDLGLCCNDWSRKFKSVGNIHQTPFAGLWMSESFVATRTLLLQGDRAALDACESCDVNGILQGKESAKLWRAVTRT
jgi:sulfatase maturation enzyme AslB (radical SAM superfamily)